MVLIRLGRADVASLLHVAATAPHLCTWGLARCSLEAEGTPAHSSQNDGALYDYAYVEMLRMMLAMRIACVTRVGLLALLSTLQLNDNLQIEIEIDASVNPLGALGVYMISASLPTITKLGHPHDHAPHDDMMRPPDDITKLGHPHDHGPHDDMMRPHVVNYALFE